MSYRIDLYFPEHKLAAVCDEYDYKNRAIDYKINQEKFTEYQLNCKFLSYYSHAKDFTIEGVLNNSFQYVYVKYPS